MNASHPTKELLISTAFELSLTRPMAEITSDLVLETSGISKGSLYHHFEDFADLMEHVQVRALSIFTDSQIQGLQELMATSQTKADFLQGLRPISHGNRSPDVGAARLARIESISKALSSTRMREIKGPIQQRITNAIAEIFREANRRGWANSDLDPMAVSVFLQSLNIGSVVDILAPTQVEPEAWFTLIDLILSEVILDH